MCGAWKQGFDTPHDWNIITEPCPNADNRCVKVSRGRYLGGCTGCNGTLCVRGVKQDYDDWELPGWSGDEFWRYMTKVCPLTAVVGELKANWLKAETFHPKEWFKHDEKNHGTDGPLHTSPFDAAPITHLLLDSMESQGMPKKPDMFTTGDTAQGCGHVVRTVYQGLRSTAADYVTSAKGNLVVLTETTVDKVNLTLEDGERRASSVGIINKEGAIKTVKAKKEIVVSGGAYCSPAILLRSGIGAKEEVESFGIESKINLPGVGKNLLDHLVHPLNALRG